MVRIILFDFDGVIINEFDAHYELARKQFRNLTKEEFRRLYEGNVHARMEELESRDTGFDMKTRYDEYKKGVVIDPGIKRIIKDLSKDHILGIVSSAKEGGIREFLKKNDLDEDFSFVYGYETSKSKEIKLERILDKYGVSKGEIVFITDTLGDIVEAKKVGIKTIAVDYGYHDRGVLSKGNPDGIISNLSGIKKKLEDI